LELLNSKGAASINQLAKALLAHDASQIEYYEQITKNMVGKVLTKKIAKSPNAKLANFGLRISRL
jgi:hypothetical protein